MALKKPGDRIPTAPPPERRQVNRPTNRRHQEPERDQPQPLTS
jgi:hypothetical protein